MAKIQLENVAATASITIQLIKDYSMYTSEIISSNGTIFQSTDTETTLTFKVYKGVEDISNKIIDIEWTKFYFDKDELKEDSSWGTNTKNKNKVTISKDDIEDKLIVQVSGYSMIEGSRELVTTSRLTLMRISDIYISNIMPSNPPNNMMWMDTNTDPPILKLWNAELGLWITSGSDIPVVKNTIRNSNFWAELEAYYNIVNKDNIMEPTITTYQTRRWVTLQSKNRTNDGGGFSQEIQYPITENSNYIFSFVAYREDSYVYNGRTIKVKIDSIDEQGRTTTIVNNDEEIGAEPTSVSIQFKTRDDSVKLVVYIGTQDKAYCVYYVTELSLYNSAVMYPWELCPEDVDKQIVGKLDNDRLSVFNTMTNNGAYKAIFESNNQYYIRAAYITPTVVDKETYDLLVNRVLALENQNLNNKLTQLQNNYNALQNTLIALENRISALENSNNDSPPQEPEE